MIRNPPVPDPIRRRWRTLLVGIVFAALTGFTPAHAAEPAKPSPLPIEQMRAVAYTKEFAKRFALSEPEPGTEPSGGIQAMEFAVEAQSKRQQMYVCTLKLYFDNSLSVAYPEEGVTGAISMLVQSTHFFLWSDPAGKHWMGFSEKDRRHFSEREGRYTGMRMAYMATPDYRWKNYRLKNGGDLWKQEGFATGMFYEEHRRDLFPGLAYLKLNMACPSSSAPTYPDIDKLAVVQVWLKRQGSRNRKQMDETPDDFLRFTIPQPFYRKIIAWDRETTHYNAETINRKTRHQLEQLQPN